MIVSIAKQMLLGAICLALLFFPYAGSLARVLEIADGRDSINDLRSKAVINFAHQGEGNPNVPLKLENQDGFGDRWSIFLGTAEYHTHPATKWGIEIKPDPQGENEYRYLTIAWKADRRNRGLMIQLHGKWGFGCVHEDSCWDHRWYAGDLDSMAPVLKNPKDGGNVQKFELPEGSFSHEWKFNIIDLSNYAMNVIHAKPFKVLKGEWTVDAIAFDTDNPFPNGGGAYFDAIYFTQTFEEAEEIERLAFAVSPQDKATTTWSKIKKVRH